MCIGFVTGVVLGNAGTESAFNIKPSERLICLPEKSTRIQEIRVVRKYISDHPETAHQPAVVLVIKALHGAFPCK